MKFRWSAIKWERKHVVLCLSVIITHPVPQIPNSGLSVARIRNFTVQPNRVFPVIPMDGYAYETVIIIILLQNSRRTDDEGGQNDSKLFNDFCTEQNL